MLGAGPIGLAQSLSNVTLQYKKRNVIVMKKFITLLLALIMIVGLVGCSNEQSATDPSNQNGETENHTKVSENILLETDISVIKKKAMTVNTTETSETYIVEGILEDVFDGVYYITVDKDGNVVEKYFMATVLKLNYQHSEEDHSLIIDEKEFQEVTNELYEKVKKFGSNKSSVLGSKVYWNGEFTSDECAISNIPNIIKEFRDEEKPLRSYTTNYYDHDADFDWVLTFYESNPYEVVVVINN